MSGHNTRLPVLILGVMGIVFIILFVLSRQNTTIAPERDEPHLPAEVTESAQPTRADGIVAGDKQGTSMVAIEIIITKEGFQPTLLTVKKDATVTWRNDDSNAQTVTALDNSFSSKSLSTGQTFSYQFKEPGTYNYYSKTTPLLKAKVVVTE